MAEELVAYHAQFHDLFGRREQREWSEFYLRGQETVGSKPWWL